MWTSKTPTETGHYWLSVNDGEPIVAKISRMDNHRKDLWIGGSPEAGGGPLAIVIQRFKKVLWSEQPIDEMPRIGSVDKHFELPKDLKQKDQGVSDPSETRAFALETAKKIAFSLGIQGAAVTMDDIHEIMIDKLGFDGTELGNSAGAVFRNGDWRVVGRRASNRPTNHGHQNRIWRLSGAS